VFAGVGGGCKMVNNIDNIDVNFWELFEIAEEEKWRKVYDRYLLPDNDLFSFLDSVVFHGSPRKTVEGLWKISAVLQLQNCNAIPITLLWRACEESDGRDGIYVIGTFPLEGEVPFYRTSAIVVQTVNEGVKGIYLQLQKKAGKPELKIWL